MKRKSFFLTFFIGLLAISVFISLSAPAMAQKTEDAKDSTQTDQKAVKKPAAGKTKTSKKTVKPDKNADYWFDKGALCQTSSRHFCRV